MAIEKIDVTIQPASLEYYTEAEKIIISKINEIIDALQELGD